MTLTRNILAIHDDEYGEGTALAFPTMSSCAACVCVLDNTLVGVHKTQGTYGRHTRLFQLAVLAIGGRLVRRLYIAGWNVGVQNCHDVGQIQQDLGCQNTPTYTFNFANAQKTHAQQNGDGLEYVQHQAFKAGWFVSKAEDLCTFAFHDGTYTPRIGVKRTSKVAVDISNRDADKAQLYNAHRRDSDYMAVNESITTPSNHLHWLTFTRV
jgi:hypothetical protein